MELREDKVEPILKIKEDIFDKFHTPVIVKRKKAYTMMGFSCDNQAYFYKIPAQQF